MDTNMLHDIADLFLVSYLWIKDFKPVSKFTEGRRTLFQFRSSPELREEIEKYYAAGTTIDALTFADRYRFIINMARSVRQEGGR